jgi:hypothetical protein
MGAGLRDLFCRKNGVIGPGPAAAPFEGVVTVLI